jgi:hypothetical protein
MTPEALELAQRVLREVRVEELYALSRFLKRSGQEWHDAPFLTGLPGADDYVNGNVGLAVKLRPALGRGLLDSQYRDVPTNYTVFKYELAADASSYLDVPESGRNNTQYREIVFVPVVQLPQKPQGGISARFAGSIFVRLDGIQNEVNDSRNGKLFRSLLNGTFDLIPAVPSGHGNFSTSVSGASVQTHPAVIKGAFEIVDDVANQQGELNGNGRACVNSQAINAVRVEGEADGIRIFFDEVNVSNYELIDVMLGPSDFV